MAVGGGPPPLAGIDEVSVHAVSRSGCSNLPGGNGLSVASNANPRRCSQTTQPQRHDGPARG